ncbi:MAG: futalosine hydrolase [Nitrospiraceae bacterium]|nr:MAG: futalosine hydrolase [Nitrospiraceae bacterium]
MKFLVLLSSMPFESEMVFSRMKNVRTSEIGGKKYYKGRLGDLDLLVSNTGIGKVNAAHSATCIAERFPVRGIINIGVGGACPGSGLKVGDIAVASKEIYGDEGVTLSRGWKDMREIGIPVVKVGNRKYFNEFPVDRAFSTKVINALTGHRSLVTKSGPFVTVSSTSGTSPRAAELGKRFKKAICENMEGAAIAQVCIIYKIPMLEIRGISNIAGVRDKRRWGLKLASENCQKALLTSLAVINIV